MGASEQTVAWVIGNRGRCEVWKNICKSSGYRNLVAYVSVDGPVLNREVHLLKRCDIFQRVA